MSESKVVTVSLNPQSQFSVPIGGPVSVIPLFLSCDENICAATIALMVSRTTSITGVTPPTGALTFVIFSGSKVIETIPLPLSVPSQSLIFTTHALDRKSALLIAVESTAPADVGIYVNVEVSSIGLTYTVCCKDKKH